MGRTYNIPSNTIDRFCKTEAFKRIDGWRKEGKLLPIEDTSQHILEQYNRDMHSERLGYWPSGYAQGIRQMLQDSSRSRWIVYRDPAITLPVSTEDCLVLSGVAAMRVLKGDELATKEFSDVRDYLGLTGAYYINASYRNGLDKGEVHKWRSTRRENVFSGKIHRRFDNRIAITQINTSHYRTVDPVGREILFRPKLEQDKRSFILEPSSEPYFMAAVLRYCLETGMKRNIALHDLPTNISRRFLTPIPTVDSATDSPHSFQEKGGVFGVYKWRDASLMVAKEIPNRTVPKLPRMVFYKSELDDLLQGLIICTTGETQSLLGKMLGGQRAA
jgi:hypothetical protein